MTCSQLMNAGLPQGCAYAGCVASRCGRARPQRRVLKVTAAAQSSPPPSSTPSPGAGQVDVGQAAQQASPFHVLLVNNLSTISASVTELRTEVRTEIKDLGTEIKALRTDFQAEMKDLRSDFQAEMKEQGTRFQTEMKDLRSEFQAEMKEQGTRFQTEMKDLRSEFQAEMKEQGTKITVVQVITAIMLGLGLVEISVPGGAKELASILFAAAALK